MNKREQELLSRQVLEILNDDQTTNKGKSQKQRKNANKKMRRRKRRKRILIALSSVLMVLFLFVLFVMKTKTGRGWVYKAASDFVYGNVKNEDDTNEDQIDGDYHAEDTRKEDYVKNYLIFGIEKIGGAKNTDSMMIATINTKDKSVKLTSLLRDSYVEIPGYKANKLNSAYSKGGVKLLLNTVEHNYKIHLDGYASVDFEGFEQIIDMLGGVTIELGKEEADYLNKTNYISKKSNRNVKPGVNVLNGNQAMGYVRVRKVKTLGGANHDYGRVVRQQRVLKAIFDQYISPNNIFKILPITKEGLSYVTTNLTQKQIEEALEAVIENKITTIETFRVPVDGAFEAPKKYNGIGYPLVLDWDKNRLELYQFIYGDTQEEARDLLPGQ